jgi:hypothetical protein
MVYYSQSSSLLDVVALRFAQSSSFISPGDSFSGASAGTGTVTFGFLTRAGNVGWLQVDFGGQGNPVQYLAGAWEDAGNRIHVGGAEEVPLPGTLALAGLGLLAMGAAGRRKRKAAETVH